MNQQQRIMAVVGVAVAAGLIALIGGTALASTPSPGAGAGPGDPNIVACQTAHAVCDPSARAKQLALVPFASPPTQGAAPQSRDRIETVARGAGHASRSATTYSALMTVPAFEALTGQTANPGLDRGRSLWIVTVYAPMYTQPAPGIPAVRKDVYSFAYDGVTGHWVQGCIGCAWLTHST